EIFIDGDLFPRMPTRLLFPKPTADTVTGTLLSHHETDIHDKSHEDCALKFMNTFSVRDDKLRTEFIFKVSKEEHQKYEHQQQDAHKTSPNNCHKQEWRAYRDS